jgi:hypothetical protein
LTITGLAIRTIARDSLLVLPRGSWRRLGFSSLGHHEIRSQQILQGSDEKTITGGADEESAVVDDRCGEIPRGKG